MVAGHSLLLSSLLSSQVFRGEEEMGDGGQGSAMEACVIYGLMILKNLCLALLLVLVQSAVDPSRHVGVSATVLVVYQQIVSALVISSLALLFERGKRPKPSFQIICWSFFIGSLQIPLGELMLTASLQYITAALQSVSLNTIPVVVFVLAVAFRRERFSFCDLYGQAKLLGILASAAGATVLALLPAQGSTLTGDSPAAGAAHAHAHVLGCLMLALAVLAESLGSLLVERVILKYPADLTLSAMMSGFGTLQTAILAALMERNPSSWRINWREGSLQIFTILYGGILINGLLYYVNNWCIHKKGPVFSTSFSPLLIVFSFLLEMLTRGSVPRFGSIVGAVLVVGGLYLLLWAKAKDYKKEMTDEAVQKLLMESLNTE